MAVITVAPESAEKDQRTIITPSHKFLRNLSSVEKRIALDEHKPINIQFHNRVKSTFQL